MTPGNWVATVLLVVGAGGAGVLAYLSFGWAQRERDRAYGDRGMALTIAIAFVVISVACAATCWIPFWWQHNTEGGRRDLRNFHQTTNVTKSPERVVKVYSATGELVATYSGKFDVGKNDGWIDLDIHRTDGTIQRVLIRNTAGSITVEDVAR